MNPRVALNIVLVLLVAGLAVFAVYEPGHEPAQERARLTTLQPGQIERIGFAPRIGEAIDFARQDTTWFITSPVEARADGARLESLLEILSAPSHAHFPARELDLAQFELADPRRVLILNGQRMSFGNTDPVNRRRYVLFDDQVHLITDLFYHYLITDLPSYVDPRLLPPDSEPAALTLPARALVRDADGSWEVNPPAGDLPADAVPTLLDNWRRARAVQVKRYEQTADGASVHVRLAGGETLSYVVVTGEDELVLVRPDIGMAYHMPAAAAEHLLDLSPPIDKGPRPATDD